MKLFLGVPLLLAACFLACCASSKIKEASALGKGGSDIAGNAQKPLAGMRQRVADDLPVEQLSSLIGGLPAPSANEVAQRESIQASLKLREKVLDQLAKCYTSFSALADYTAGDTISGDVKGLADSVNTFAKAVGSKTGPISDGLSSVLQQGSKAITEEEQLKMLRAASEDIRTRLTAFRGILEQDRAAHLSMMTVIAGDQEVRFKDLIAADHTAAQPLLDKSFATLGLKATNTLVDKAFANPAQAATQLNAMMKDNEDGLIALHMKIYDTTVTTLKKLEQAHLQFEGTQKLDPYALTDQAKDLSTLADAYQKALQ